MNTWIGDRTWSVIKEGEGVGGERKNHHVLLTCLLWFSLAGEVNLSEQVTLEQGLRLLFHSSLCGRGKGKGQDYQG